LGKVRKTAEENLRLVRGNELSKALDILDQASSCVAFVCVCGCARVCLMLLWHLVVVVLCRLLVYFLARVPGAMAVVRAILCTLGMRSYLRVSFVRDASSC
jgi:hypothetical protein